MKYTPKFKQVPLNQGGGSLAALSANPVLPTAGLYNTDRIAFMDSTLKANKDLNWVKRLYTPNPKVLHNIIPGTVSSHLMGHNGEGYLFPHIVQKGRGKLQYLPTDDQAGEYARTTNTGIQFKTPEQADWFSKNYKNAPGVFQKNATANKLY